MESLYLLIPISVILVFLLVSIFCLSVRSGQFDDLEGPGFRILMDDDGPDIPQPGVEQSDKPEKS